MCEDTSDHGHEPLLSICDGQRERRLDALGVAAGARLVIPHWGWGLVLSKV